MEEGKVDMSRDERIILTIILVLALIVLCVAARLFVLV